MKKFRFRLQRVLDYRGRIREERLQELHKKNSELRQIQRRMDELERAFLENADTSGALHHSVLELKAAYGERLKNEMEHVKLAILEAEKEVEEALLQYREALQEEEALVKLRDRRRAEYDEHVEQEEMKFLDELSVQKGNTLEG